MPVSRISNSRKAACVNKYIQTESITTTRRWYTTTYGEIAPSANSIKGGTADFWKTERWKIFLGQVDLK